MSRGESARRLGLLLSTAALICAALGPINASAAAPPEIGPVWTAGVTATTAVLHAEVNPGAQKTHYRFDYLPDAAYRANLEASPPRDPFAGAARAPVGLDANIAPSASFEEVFQHVGGLSPQTDYRYRILATNASGETSGTAHAFLTQSSVSDFALPDHRGWELVSPPEKNGGEIEGPGQTLGGGVIQAAAQGGGITYSSTSSFAAAEGAPGASQYLGARTASGWSAENITPPAVSGGFAPEGSPYQLFSADLSLGVLTNGRRCRTEGEDCPVPNPPLPGSGAPPGYRNYYLRDSAGIYRALLDTATLNGQPVSAGHFDLDFLAATPDLAHLALSTCAALTPDAISVPTGEDSCDPTVQNLYLYSAAGLRLINLLPGQATGTPGARLAAPAGAISADGGRVYWGEEPSGDLFLREAARTIAVDSAATFQAASNDGRIAFYSKADHLYRFDAATETSTDLTPAGGLEGVLGASADGSYLYYLSAAGLSLWHEGSSVDVAPAAAASSYPPATGTARVTPDGRHLLFLSSEALTPFETFGEPQLYLYDPTADSILCVSCNPTGERPEGPASIPAATANGAGPEALRLYRPRVLADDGARVFFDSADALIPTDTNHEPDVYEWQAQGSGGCGRAEGCIAPISSGREADGATFLDASADGADAFFLTDASLLPADHGGLDVYDARSGGGFPEPPPPLSCFGDACQTLPPPPADPTPGTGFYTEDGNPPIHSPRANCRKGQVRKHGRCKNKPQQKKRHAHRGGDR